MYDTAWQSVSLHNLEVMYRYGFILLPWRRSFDCFIYSLVSKSVFHTNSEVPTCLIWSEQVPWVVEVGEEIFFLSLSVTPYSYPRLTRLVCSDTQKKRKIPSIGTLGRRRPWRTLWRCKISIKTWQRISSSSSETVSPGIFHLLHLLICGKRFWEFDLHEAHHYFFASFFI